MPEHKTFIPDSRPDMTTNKKNMQLSAELANAPNVDRNIVKIARDATDSGWEISYLE
jgi:hypothetical protein